MFRLRSGMATLQSKALPLGMRDSKRLWRIGWLLASLIIFILTAFILLKGTFIALPESQVRLVTTHIFTVLALRT